jgi:xylan 1,4-beta-xylosidase
MPRHLDLAAKYGVNLMGAVTWAFEFEDQPYFDGFRDLATNGIDKPVLNVFRMLGTMTGSRVPVNSDGAVDLDSMLAAGVKGKPDVNAMASIDAHSASVLISNYHDSDSERAPARIALNISGLPPGRVMIEHFRVDDQHGNSYEAWKRMGSPQHPTPGQYEQLVEAGQLHLLESPSWDSAQDGRISLAFSLPVHGVSLIRLTW